MKCPGCGQALTTRHLDDGVEVLTCPYCSGVFYDAGQLAVRLEVPGAAPGERRCPRDGQTMVKGIVKGSQVEIDGCMACGGVWLDAGEVQKLRATLGVEEMVKGKADAPPPPLPVPGGSTARPSPKPKADQSAEPVDTATQTNFDAKSAPSVFNDGRTYEHFQTSWPKVTYVVGEFPWQVKVGDQAKTRDFVCPPYLMSEEVTASDTSWSHGEYVEGPEVWSGFGLKGEPPARRGTAPNQPNPQEDAWRALRFWAFGAAAAAVVLYGALSSVALRQAVLQQNCVYDLRAAGERSFVTEEFELKGRTSNVRVNLVTNLDNGWGFFRMALINVDTEVALDFEREVSYYHGYEDGESWSEGGQSDHVSIPSVPSGRYYLRVEPESEMSFSYNVSVLRDVPALSPPFIAVLALLLPILWIMLRRHIFEVSRWAESDHPKTSSDDDDD